MKNWLIKKLGGATRDELKDLRQLLVNLHVLAQGNADVDLRNRDYYTGRAGAYGTASRYVEDLLR